MSTASVMTLVDQIARASDEWLFDQGGPSKLVKFGRDHYCLSVDWMIGAEFTQEIRLHAA